MTSRMTRRAFDSTRGRRSAVLSAAVCVLLTGHLGAQQPNPVRYTDPWARFSVELPQNWGLLAVSGSGEPIVALTQPKLEAAVVIERFVRQQRLASDQVTELFAEIEADVLKENQPRATNIVAKLVTESGRRVVVIDYFRPGLVGTAERVRQYSFPSGQQMYRITCNAIGTQFDKYEPTFAMVAASFKSLD